MTIYNVHAKNYSESSENRIHSDEIAQKFGFRGALVPGVAVYGHLVYPLVDTYGVDWLSHSVNEIRLLKPAYDGDLLSVDLHSDATGDVVNCTNDRGELLATLKSTNDQAPAFEATAELDGPIKHPERVEIAWDNVTPGVCFAPWQFTLSEAENRKYADQVADTSPIYDEYVHPHLLQSLANTALMNEYIMPTWMHVGSQTHHREALRVGDTITIRSVTKDRWQKKGHEFIRIHVTYWRDDQLTTDILHTAIFKVAV